MSLAVRSEGSASQIVFEEEVTLPAVFEDESVPRLLTNLDIASRSEARTVAATCETLLEYARRDGISERYTVKQILLLAFRRRNHLKSQAEGEGSGEKALFLEILVAIVSMGKFNDLISAVLPLVPLYGSWRDLLLIAEELSLRAMRHTADELSFEPLISLICKLFADQLAEDQRGVLQDISGSQSSATADSSPMTAKFTPSNACKYAPHEGRHNSSKSGKTKETKKPVGRRGRKVKRRHRYTSSLEDEVSNAEEAKMRHKINKSLSLRVAKIINEKSAADPSTESATLAHYRKLRAMLNKVLTDRGHLVEPLMVKNQAANIRFSSANKSSLTKYEKSIKKNPVAKSRWQRAMMRDLNAVPDIESLFVAVQQCLDENHEIEEEKKKMHDSGINLQDSSQPLLLSLRIKKALVYLRTRLNQVSQDAHVLRSAARSDSVVERTVSTIRQIAVVDSCCADDQVSRMSLLLSAALLSLAQNNQFFILDGYPIYLPTNVEDDLAAWLLQTTKQYLSFPAVDDLQGNLVRMRSSLEAVLIEHRKQCTDCPDMEASVVDAICLCVHFAVYDSSSTEFHNLLLELQAPTASGPSLRTFRVHRLRGGSSAHSSSVDYIPRPPNIRSRALPVIATQMTADVLLLVDFTGSMGMWMNTVKRELLSLVQEIQQSSRMKKVRVALVGYRDYNDAGRVVTVDFKDQASAGELVDELKRQHASGGGDAPEDLLSGLLAASNLDWNSDLRFCVVVTDAPAHGYADGSHDSYPGGRCPDQMDTLSLPECVRSLAVEKEMDMFFCLLSENDSSLQKTIDALKEPYVNALGGCGFGTVSMTRTGKSGSNESYFREQLVAQLTTAIASSIVAKDLSGLQSADGVTLSSLAQSLLASLRQTFVAEANVALADLSIVNDSKTTDDAPKPPSSTEEVSPPLAPTTSVAAPAAAAGESDWQRLQRDLRNSSLYPVRLALGLPLHVSPASTSDQDLSTSLSTLAAEALCRAGLTVELLVQQNFPDQIIQVFRDHVAAKLASL